MQMEIEVAIDDKHQAQNPARGAPSASDRETQRRQIMIQSQQCELNIIDMLQGLHAYHRARMDK